MKRKKTNTDEDIIERFMDCIIAAMQEKGININDINIVDVKDGNTDGELIIEYEDKNDKHPLISGRHKNT